MTQPLPPDILLSVQNLSVDFPLRTSTLHAVRDVSFELHRGETLCLVGESGSGKSVTARSIMRIVDKPGRLVGGRILLNLDTETRDLATLQPNDHRVRAIRGARIGSSSLTMKTNCSWWCARSTSWARSRVSSGYSSKPNTSP